MSFTYLLINLGIIAGPLWLSRDRDVAYPRNFPALAVATIIVGALYIAWDLFATAQGDWSFNPRYVTGVNIKNLPVEEICFFVTVPYACLFIYEVLASSAREKRLCLPTAVLWAAVGALLAGTWLFANQSYTSKALSSCVVFLGFALWLDRPLLESRHYWLWLAVCLMPFAIVNTILTALPVVQYNSSAIWGVRIGTIPVEDFFYNYSLLSFYLLSYRLIAQHRTGRSRIA
jgi:lycopene cyclase domain-containing protein